MAVPGLDPGIDPAIHENTESGDQVIDLFHKFESIHKSRRRCVDGRVRAAQGARGLIVQTNLLDLSQERGSSPQSNGCTRHEAVIGEGPALLEALRPAAVDQDALLLFQVRVLGEELDFAAVGQPQHTFASVALEGGRGHEPDPLFDDRVAAELAFKGESDVPQSG
jgi:hypothetical protein